MTGELTINGVDAYTAWGITLDDSALSALMTPPGLKDSASEDYALEHGTQYDDAGPMIAEREISLTINLIASDAETFLMQYNDFCRILQKRNITIATKYQPGIVYRCRYKDCRQFTQFMRGMAKFNLRLVEPDPTNRSAQ